MTCSRLIAASTLSPLAAQASCSTNGVVSFASCSNVAMFHFVSVMKPRLIASMLMPRLPRARKSDEITPTVRLSIACRFSISQRKKDAKSSTCDEGNGEVNGAGSMGL
eukprot:599929-Prymnesium_polylepis.1